MLCKNFLSVLGIIYYYQCMYMLDINHQFLKLIKTPRTTQSEQITSTAVRVTYGRVYQPSIAYKEGAASTF